MCMWLHMPHAHVEADDNIMELVFSFNLLWALWFKLRLPSLLSHLPDPGVTWVLQHVACHDDNTLDI